MDERLGEITALKSLLTDTDYKIIKSAEGLLTCTSITDLLDKMAGITTDLQETIQKRVEWRARINELEEVIKEDNFQEEVINEDSLQGE